MHGKTRWKQSYYYCQPRQRQTPDGHPPTIWLPERDLLADGAWHPSHGSWAYQLELPAGHDRRRAQLRRSGHHTRDQAQAELDHAKALLRLAGGDPLLTAQVAGMLRACKPGTPLPDVDTVTRRLHTTGTPNTAPTFGEYLHRWLQGRGHLAANTLRCYREHIDHYLKPHLGHIRLDQLTVGHLQAMFDAITGRDNTTRAARASADPAVRATVKGRKTMGDASRQRLRATARKAINDAMRIHHRGLLTHNPAAHLELPSGRTPRPKVWTPKAVHTWKTTGSKPGPVMVWTPAQAGEFLDHAQTHDIVLYPMYLLIMNRGLRRGEAVGLRDIDVDLDHAEELTIAQQIIPVDHTPITTRLKTDASERVVALDTVTAAVLADHLRRRETWRQAHPDDWPDTGLFFVTPTGKPWHPQVVSRRFDRLVTAAGLPPIRLHDLRHGAATYLRAAGADLKTVQTTLGHADHKITSDVYTSVLQELERATAEAAAALIPRNTSALLQQTGEAPAP